MSDRKVGQRETEREIERDSLRQVQAAALLREPGVLP